MSHTEGPWTANLGGAYGNHAGGFSVETHIDGVGLFVVCGRAGVPSRAAESHTNARLIAAAPELLAAARLAVDAIGQTRDDFGLKVELEKAYLALCAAIANAKGAA